jgi:hypothetical protein
MGIFTLSPEQLKNTPTEQFQDEPIREIHHFPVCGGGYWEIFPERPRTLRACWEVLCRLPFETTESLMYGETSVVFAPDRVWGFARPWKIPATGIPSAASDITDSVISLKFVYLAPEIEGIEERALVGVVAHELAHVVIGEITGVEAEVRADNLIREWGFGTELEAVRQINPRHHY